MAIKKGEQLALFHTAAELQARPVHPDVLEAREPTSQFWRRKEVESRVPYGTPDLEEEGETAPGAGVYDSIKKHGFTSHIKIEESGEIAEGYHRVAAAARIEKESGQPMHIPVLHGQMAVADSKSRFGVASLNERHWPQTYDNKWFR